MSIYRGPGGSGDAVSDAASEVLLAVEAKNQAIAAQLGAEAAQTGAESAQTAAEAAQTAAEAAQAAAELAETHAETAEANAETAEVNAETAQAAAEAAQAAAEAVLVDADFQTVVGLSSEISTVASLETPITEIADGIIPTKVLVIPDGTSISINTNLADFATQANTQAAGTLTINAPTGTITNAQRLVIRIRCTNAQTLSWNSVFDDSDDLPLPTSTSGSSKYDYFGFFYNGTAAKWQLVARVMGF